jgi:ABC-type glycerol-3-phosphate transport system permease component
LRFSQGFMTLDAFVKVLSAGDILRWYVNSAITSIIITVVVVLLLIVFMFFQKQIVQGIAGTGLKG